MKSGIAIAISNGRSIGTETAIATGTTIRKKLGRDAKLRLKNGIFNPSYSRPPANTLKGGTILYSLVPKKSLRKRRQGKKAHKNSKKKKKEFFS